MPKQKPIICPMCGKPAILDGSQIDCESCDAIYTITKEGGARVRRTGVFEDHEKRIAALEQPAPAAPGEPEELEELEESGQPGEDEEVFPE